MLRKTLASLPFVVAACSLVNAPDDVQDPNALASTTTTSSVGSGGSGGEGGAAGSGGVEECAGQDDGTPCGDDGATDCDTPDSCEDGACVPNFVDEGEPCGDDTDEICTKPDTCDGAGQCQPNHAAADLPCGSAVAPCDRPDFCDGEGECVDGVAPEGSICADSDAQCLAPDECNDKGDCLDKGIKPDGEACTSPFAGGCVAGECRRAACASGGISQYFSRGMVGCAGSVTYPDRSQLCAFGSRVCTADEWVQNRNGIAPSFIYWTADVLKYDGSGPGDCVAGLDVMYACTADRPMRVCNGASDSRQNTCTYYDCSYEEAGGANEYFGGCNSNPTAGALCCLTLP